MKDLFKLVGKHVSVIITDNGLTLTAMADVEITDVIEKDNYISVCNGDTEFIIRKSWNVVFYGDEEFIDEVAAINESGVEISFMPL